VSDLCTSEVYEDFYKCYDLATHAASYWPEAPGVWTGTVSERLARLFQLEHLAREEAEIELAKLRAMAELRRSKDPCRHERQNLRAGLQNKINPAWPDDYDLPG
jgi:hypothetical protein